jgi:micrococcal nuclease
MNGDIIRKYAIILMSILLAIIISECLYDNNSQISEKFEKYNSDFDEQFEGKIVKVVDGDTVDVMVRNGTIYRVRLLGVDTPETYIKNKPDEYIMSNGKPITNITYLKIWGKKATTYAKRMLDNKTVMVVFDGKSQKKGRYGRYLAYIYVDNINFNEELIKNGYARVYISNFELKNKFLEEERKAKDNKIGLWNWSNS